MWSKLGNYRDFALLVLRIGVGGCYLWIHGWPKLAAGVGRWRELGGNMSHLGIDFAPVFWGVMATFSETIGAALLILGLFFRPASLLLFLTMSVATVTMLSTGPLKGAAHPMEMAFVFFALIFLGPGKFSVDKG